MGGWSFWLVLIAGALCMVVGLSISIIDLMYPRKFSTIMEMDYGTPFDRHTIIEDSHETKKKKKWAPKLEEPAGNGLGGLLRRLSKRDRDRSNYGMDGMHRNPQGTDNYAFEMEAPKSPWRYPHLMFRSESRKNKGVTFKPSNGLQSMNPGLQDFGPMNYLRRTDSKDSSCTSLSSASHMHDRALTASMSVPAVAFGNKFRRTDSTDSSTSSLASFSQMFGLSRGRPTLQAVLPPPVPRSKPSHCLNRPLLPSRVLVYCTVQSSVLVYCTVQYSVLVYCTVQSSVLVYCTVQSSSGVPNVRRTLLLTTRLNLDIFSRDCKSKVFQLITM